VAAGKAVVVAVAQCTTLEQETAVVDTHRSVAVAVAVAVVAVEQTEAVVETATCTSSQHPCAHRCQALIVIQTVVVVAYSLSIMHIVTASKETRTFHSHHCV
jgi:hypothetical protein